MKRMTFGLCLAAAACMMLSIMAAPAAAEYPEKPINILCWSKPGSSVDLMARGIAKLAEKYVGQPMSVVTKAGGGGTVAMAHLLKQKPDGYTLLAATRSFAFQMAWAKTKMKPSDFALISRLIVEAPIFAVHANRPYDTWEKFVAAAKKNPNTIKVANSGSGMLHHTIWLRIKKAAGIETIDVPYSGGRPAITSAMGGHDDAVVNNPSVMKTPIKEGKLKGLFTFGEKRIDALPDIPTLKELGIDIVEYQWRGMMTLAGVPRDRIEFIARALKKMTKEPEWIEFIKNRVWMHGYMRPDEFKPYVDQQIKEIRETLIGAGLIKK
ncbi:MAG: tripartite tricarboxylate transporter substrate binding protein [Deltaproteobacteria bacterium]|nr:tripartite tricarboxylate transporter substrate binding protein [Deltaproteobacteria bacterium]MBW2308828.1 tripartite tricarboxylate transporter substrate binding protein [Deltaproteobacteria bacterium]